MSNFTLNLISASILGAILAPASVANAEAPADAFAQDASAGETTQDAAGSETLDEFGTFEIAVEDVPLPQVLNMLAIQSRRNIITSKRVGSVSVTANLFDVTFYEALESVLHIASLCYEEQGNFIYVMTCDEKTQRIEANRVLEDRVFYLDHISPGDAESLAKPLLSEKGTMSKLGEAEGGFQPGKTEAGGDGWAHEPVLVIRDFAENLDAVQALLVDVDTPPKQVMVESTILVTRAKGDYAWGMDVSVLLKADFTSLLNPLNPVSWLQNLQQQPQAGTGNNPEGQTQTDNAMAIQSTVGQTTEAGGFKFGILNNNIGVFLRLLDEVSDSTILARPKILALNRQRAQVLVGERVAYLSTTQTETAATQTVQFLETGINLILRPFISRDGSIRMELYPSVSSATLRQIGDASGIGVTTVPDESTNEITTNVRVRDGETVVLGGLFMDESTINRRSVPGLGDVPLVGDAFSGQSDDVKRQEIIFLVTPTIIREEVMTKASAEAEELVGNVLVGVREGLLPWARETLATNSNHDAYQAIDSGDVDLAISHINRSLRNNPNQPEIVQMREDLLGQRSIYADDGDVLHGVFERTFGRAAEVPAEPAPVSDPLSSRTQPEPEPAFDGGVPSFSSELELVAVTDETETAEQNAPEADTFETIANQTFARADETEIEAEEFETGFDDTFETVVADAEFNGAGMEESNATPEEVASVETTEKTFVNKSYPPLFPDFDWTLPETTEVVASTDESDWKYFGDDVATLDAGAETSDPFDGGVFAGDFLFEGAAPIAGFEPVFVDEGAQATGSFFSGIFNARNINWWSKRGMGDFPQNPDFATAVVDTDE